MKKILLAFALVAGLSAVSYAQSSSSATAEPAKVEVAGQSNEAASTDKAATPSKSSSTKSCCSHKKSGDASCGGSKKAKAQNDAIKEEDKPSN